MKFTYTIHVEAPKSWDDPDWKAWLDEDPSKVKSGDSAAMVISKLGVAITIDMRKRY
jgi:hypothetical protein